MSSNIDLTNPHNLSSVLELLSANDTETVKKGEKMLKSYLKKQISITGLIYQLENSQNVSVRHHAALLLKKKIGVFIQKFSNEQRSSLKLKVLSLLLSESNKAICNAIVGSVASLAKSLFAVNDLWPELFTLLMQLSVDALDNHRALTFSLLEQVNYNNQLTKVEL
jgi:hypothetical protein